MLSDKDIKGALDVVRTLLGLELDKNKFLSFIEDADLSFYIDKWGADDSVVKNYICEYFYKILVGHGRVPLHPKKEGDQEFWDLFDIGAKFVGFKVIGDDSPVTLEKDEEELAGKQPAATKEHLEAILANIQYKDWKFFLGEDLGGRLFLQVRFLAHCVVSGKLNEQRCRKWWVSPYMTETEIVDTAFKAVLSAEEHEAKEKFKYHNKVIHNPHISVRTRMEFCSSLEQRL